ncbi:MAG: uridine diphosphate-N-acetylglucosamine-binding protein YvcK [Acidobacteria bacterium]|nr:uridine diphosphate-N-acetylglucosamine-binding protein YvcK [Acidobacteriota bacterium]
MSSNLTSSDLYRKPLRIVAIGGGTGLSALLHGLKTYAAPERPMISITAIVTVTDDGGSSGRLRRDFSVLPPGDIRACMVALSEDETLLSRMFQYRFRGGRGLKGHSFGNLFLTALTDLTGDFAHAVRLASEILASRGDIIPSTAENVVLEAQLADGRVIKGESNISKSRSPIEWIHILPRSPEPFRESLEAIRQADLITLGPGSLFTSVIPNMLVRSIPREIIRATGVRAYMTNLMAQPGETTNFTASDHVRAILKHCGVAAKNASRLLDYVVVNNAPLHSAALSRYAAQKALPVEMDIERLQSMGLRVLEANLAESDPKIRHSPSRTAELVLKLARLGRRRRQLMASAAART